jgi:hypothetical protein
MIEDPADPGGRLITFRLRAGVVWPPRKGDREGFEAERIAGHRQEYLVYEGPVSGNRGTVRREGTGECRVELGDGAMVLGFETGLRLIGRPLDQGGLTGRWVFNLESD